VAPFFENRPRDEQTSPALSVLQGSGGAASLQPVKEQGLPAPSQVVFMLLEPQTTNYDLNWKMLGIPVRIHPLFWLTTVLLGWKPGIAFGKVSIWVVCVFVSILVHEFGHALTAKRYGAQNLRVVLYGLGGLAISEGGLNRRQFIVHVLMGPGAGFILYGLVKGLSLAAPVEDLPVQTRYYTLLAMDFLMQINLIWGLVNLLPIYPLDGGQVSRALFVARHPHQGIAASLRVSRDVAMGMALLMGLLALLTVLKIPLPEWIPFEPSLFNILFFVFLAYMSHQLSRPELLHAEEDRREEVARQPWERDPDWWKK